MARGEQDWLLDLDRGAIQRSLSAQLGLEFRWQRYLRRPRTWKRFLMNVGLLVGRVRRWLFPPNARSLRRLLNIERSHLDLLEQGLASGAHWIVILEDDALTSDVQDLAVGLAGLTVQESIAYVNLSHSFDHAGLGIAHVLERSTQLQWAGSTAREMFIANPPVTNTVCAIAYHREFIVELLETWKSLPIDPVVPIDWKLNEALMRMHQKGHGGTAADGLRTCVFVEPPPIRQGSMAPRVNS